MRAELEEKLRVQTHKMGGMEKDIKHARGHVARVRESYMAKVAVGDKKIEKLTDTIRRLEKELEKKNAGRFCWCVRLTGRVGCDS